MGKRLGEFPMTNVERCHKYREDHLDKERARCVESHKKRLKTNLELFTKLRPIRCDRCGYDRCFGALDFHHTEASQKKNTHDSLGYWLRQLSPDKFVAKILNTKYELLCANCHRELHYNEES